jgi:hypothetical protein
MIDLTPEDEALLSRAREGLKPGADDHARIKRRLLTQIAATTVAATAALSTSAEAAGTTAVVAGASTSAGALTVVAKVIAVGALVAAMVGGGIVGVQRLSTPHAAATVPASVSGPARVAPLPPETESVQPAPASSFVNSAQPAVVDRPRPLAAPPPPPGMARVVESPSAGATGPSTVAAEAELLARAGAALKSGDPALALELLDEHAASFPAGVLIEEREAERVVVLCALGRTNAARGEAEKFLRERPRSPMAGRVRGSCGGS